MLNAKFFLTLLMWMHLKREKKGYKRDKLLFVGKKM